MEIPHPSRLQNLEMHLFSLFLYIAFLGSDKQSGKIITNKI